MRQNLIFFGLVGFCPPLAEIQILTSSVRNSLLRPKSVSTTWPSESRRIFSSFISRYIIPNCRQNTRKALPNHCNHIKETRNAFKCKANKIPIISTDTSETALKKEDFKMSLKKYL